MTQYQVPQFIDMESRIIGPLTLKQFLYLAMAGAILFVLWFLLIPAIWMVIAVPVAAIAATFAFLKINDRPFVYFFLSLLKYFGKPKLYIFSPMPPETKQEIAPKKEEPAILESVENKLTPLKLKELATILDTGMERTDEQP
ncbi:MAG: hypothetical protein UV53_C0011G0008 [Candidatus Azambacteria bacterium GW2011_GWE1_42_9]|nr:MAG: hypothetical protein UU33_C0001G0370 [Candidatus Azambacteria bacterium GW2011_GWF1_41_10]KKS49404.1 MAG: hypothetical protein UV14_C0001G0150 [Candidatus Azambacteria bacterium GW2011_GWF2_42_22]KKS69465.1 MAG: hypothetical protein UV39_C0010G0005 [Candidatus Azambacteria bacterium GW2011_GWA2_42_62]KKS74326.1 MAG: hypothetical protein UV45_C0007G0020 [Candidatus Azambacteria bacterium GW2011_GWB1_42_72]KKS79235.1 MAG: hypothetical protein UV53_C0011G0008 [Candidatus Azambacteria bacte